MQCKPNFPFSLYFIMALWLMACSSCSHQRLKSTGQCLTQNEARSPLESLNRLYEDAVTDPNERNAPLRLVKDECWKKIYHRGQYQIVIYQSEANPETAAGVIGVIKKNQVDVKQCLDNALRSINSLKLDFGKQLIGDYKFRFPRTWNDTDIGPMMWLDCNAQNQATWSSSLATFLHEISHSLTQNNCLYMNASQPACLQIGNKPPTAEIARLDQYPSPDSKVKGALDFVQNLYLHNHEEFWTFLDEIRAYSITTATEAASIEKFGLEGVFQNAKIESSRNYLILPQMLYHLGLYLNRFAQREPQRFSEFWNQHNAGIVKKIIEQSHFAMFDWIEQMAKKGSKMRPVEEYFWQASQKELQSLLNKVTQSQEARLSD